MSIITDVAKDEETGILTLHVFAIGETNIVDVFNALQRYERTVPIAREITTGVGCTMDI